MLGAPSSAEGAFPWPRPIRRREYLIVYHFIAQEFGSGLISVVQPIDFVVTVAIESVSADPLTLLFWGFAMFQAVAIPWAAMRPAAALSPMQPA